MSVPVYLAAPITEAHPCPACGKLDFEPYLRGEDYHYGNEGSFQFHRCRACLLWVTVPMPTPDVLAGLYPTEYYSFQQPGSGPGTNAKERLRKLVGLDRQTYLPRAGRPGHLLDVGCGAGHYIYRLQRRGWRVSGIEPSAAAVAAGRAAGLDIQCGDIHHASFPPGTFDVVRFNHSFEHVPDPLPTLIAARSLLKSDGYLFIGVPNTRGLWARLFKQWWWYFGVPVHTFGFDPENLRLMLERAGFALEQVRYNSEFAGLLGSLQIWLNRNKRPRLSSGRVLSSLVLRLPAFWISRLLDALKQGDCIEVIARPKRPAPAARTVD